MASDPRADEQVEVVNFDLPAGFAGIPTTKAASDVAHLSAPVASTSTGVLLAANTARLGGAIFNDSTANLYVAFAAVTSTAVFTVKVGAGQFFDIGGDPVYRGVISGVWDAANGHARVTELV